MVASAESVAFLHDDGLTDEQRAALERAGDLGWTVKAVQFADVGADSTNGTTPAGRLTERFDILCGTPTGRSGRHIRWRR